jgi:large subunit ribosomal protein L6
MSRIGKKPVPIPKGVKAEMAASSSRPPAQGQPVWTLPSPITAKIEGSDVVVERPDDEKRSKALHGLSRALIANMVKGVHEGYEIKLEVYGTGYGADVRAGKLMLNCGYMGRGVGKKSQFEIPIPAGIEVKVRDPHRPRQQ